MTAYYIQKYPLKCALCLPKMMKTMSLAVSSSCFSNTHLMTGTCQLQSLCMPLGCIPSGLVSGTTCIHPSQHLRISSLISPVDRMYLSTLLSFINISNVNIPVHDSLIVSIKSNWSRIMLHFLRFIHCPWLMNLSMLSNVDWVELSSRQLASGYMRCPY